jgi:hypothetical protein
MTWFRIDDNFDMHPKALAAGNAALGLWVRCGSYAARQLTDGFIPAEVARLYGTPKEVAALVASGLWTTAPGGYEMHQYLERNRSRDDVLAERKATAQRVARWKERQRNASSNGVTNSVDDGVSNGPPDPTRPDPSRSSPSSKKTTSTASTGVADTAAAAEALELYADIDLATRSITDVRNPRSYRRSIVGNAAIEHGPAILALLAERPDATPLDILTGPLGVDPFTARSALAKREAS